MSGAILVLSGPSGAGKSSLLKGIMGDIGDFYFSISTTSRKARENEKDGVEYFFVDKKTFKQEIKDQQFLEYASVHGNYYGTSLKPVYKALEEGKLVIFDIDVQGHEAIRKILPDLTTSVFISPLNKKILKKRLYSRATDSEEVIENRLKKADEELRFINTYDYFLINDNLEKTTQSLLKIAQSAKLKKSKTEKDIFIKEWL
jgi:guanylate kinase